MLINNHQEIFKSVKSDDYYGGQLIARFLKNKGYVNPVFILPTKSNKSIDLRLKGLRDESSKIGYKLKDEQTYLGSIPKHNGLTEEVEEK